MTMSVTVDSSPQGKEPRDDSWKRWVSELRYTWALAIFLCVAPAVVYGAAFPAGYVLIGTSVFGFPTGLAALLVRDKAWSRRFWRRLVVLGSISFSSFAIVSQTDKLSPLMANAIVQAIEQFRLDTNAYPKTLEDLTPKYLEQIPAVRVAIQQPEITYVLRSGHPRLSIPSAVGDAFAVHEYDFEGKAWIQYK